ncbi:hypothetical protein [Vogesella sp. AC12]|nr:hypothetical protein [Vogesella sp. AC12]
MAVLVLLENKAKKERCGKGEPQRSGRNTSATVLPAVFFILDQMA